MKKIMIIILLMSSISIFAVSNACSFTLINPSAAGMALGVTGWGADIWNQNPLDVWSNPAKLGYYEGLSVGYSHDSYLETVFDDIYFDNSYLTFRWMGIGFMVPMINNKAKFGSSIDYGEQDLYDEDGNFIKTYNSWESSTGFALGMNLLEFYGDMQNNEEMRTLQPYTDISIGYNVNFINSTLAPDITEYSHSDGLGVIFRVSPLNELNYLNNSYVKTDFVISSYYRNISKTNIDYGGRKYPVASSTDNAISFRLSVDKEGYKEIINPDIYDKLSIFCKNIISMSYYNGYSYCDKSYVKRGLGVELTLLDLVSLRHGYYEDKQGNNRGVTSGIGINFRYNDLFHLQCNYAKYPGGILLDYQEKLDIMLNVNYQELLAKNNSKGE